MRTAYLRVPYLNCDTAQPRQNHHPSSLYMYVRFLLPQLFFPTYRIMFMLLPLALPRCRAFAAEIVDFDILPLVALGWVLDSCWDASWRSLYSSHCCASRISPRIVVWVMLNAGDFRAWALLFAAMCLEREVFGAPPLAAAVQRDERQY